MRTRPAAFAALAALAVASCGYFNSLYNARRDFSEARAAERRGEDAMAATAYHNAIENAAASYTSHGDSRWADDALMLIGRSHHALGDHEAARAAFLTLLEERPDGGLRADALAWLGASEAALGRTQVAKATLDSALAAGPSGESLALAQLWRSRVQFTLGIEDPWADLERASTSGTVFAPHAHLALVANAIEYRDTARARVAFDRLYRDRTASRWADSVATLVDAASGAFGPEFTRSAIAPVTNGDWPAEPSRQHELKRAMLAAEAGDTALAITEAIDLAGRATGTAAAARLAAARLRLAGADDVAQLDDIRAMLLPVIPDPQVQQLVRDMRAVEVMLESAIRNGQPLALFAAAEMARDQLRAPLLASRLFLTYADLAPAAVWAPKALLAAAALDGSAAAAISTRVAERPDNPYASAALSGESDAQAYMSAERQLADSLTSIVTESRRLASARDIRVGSAVARLDSIRLAALADSTRIRCGVLIDSLALTGIRSDSVRAVCMRSDSARLAEVLTIDTMMLIDTTMVRDTSRGRRTPAPFGRRPR